MWTYWRDNSDYFVHVDLASYFLSDMISNQPRLDYVVWQIPSWCTMIEIRSCCRIAHVETSPCFGRADMPITEEIHVEMMILLLKSVQPLLVVKTCSSSSDISDFLGDIRSLILCTIFCQMFLLSLMLSSRNSYISLQQSLPHSHPAMLTRKSRSRWL